MSQIHIYDAKDKDDWSDSPWLNAHAHIDFEGSDVSYMLFNGYGENETAAKKQLILEIRRAKQTLSEWLDANTPEGI